MNPTGLVNNDAVIGRSGTRSTTARRQPWAALAALAVSTVVGAWMPPHPADAAAAPLRGTLRLAPGECTANGADSTYFRMILPDGSPSGPFLNNSDSRCADQSFTPLQPGTDGGLVLQGYQPIPSPAFDKDGNALARRVTQPAPFYGTGFATSSNSTDPQTKAKVPAPLVSASGSTLTADLRAFSVIWNNQYFNQGSPKPDGSYPGNTRPAKGTYDAANGAFTLTWTSQIVGGPFDKFTGLWHLEGTFVPAASGSSAGGSTAGQGGTTGAVPAAPSRPQGGTVTALPRTASAGSPVVPGAGAQPTTSAGVALPTTLDGTQPVASVKTTRADSWSVRWPLVLLAVALAVVGFGALALLQRRITAATPQDPS